MFEKHYQNKFSCRTFSSNIVDSCSTNPEQTVVSTVVEDAAILYAAENLALLKIFIKLVYKNYLYNSLSNFSF